MDNRGEIGVYKTRARLYKKKGSMDLPGDMPINTDYGETVDYIP